MSKNDGLVLCRPLITSSDGRIRAQDKLLNASVQQPQKAEQ